MKTLIATALILTAGIAQAHSFDHEQQIGTPNLFATLGTEGVVSVDSAPSRNFAYQIAVGTPDLFPTLIKAEAQPQPQAEGSNTVFEYVRNIGTSELDPSLS